MVRVPLLFIGGRHDPVCRVELGESDTIARLVPDLSTAVVDAGHWPMMERPKDVANCIIAFLEAKGL